MRAPRKWLRVFAVFTVVALIAGACGDDDDEGAEGDDETPTTEPFDGVTLTATEYEYDAPDEMHASTVNLRGVNEGNVAHEFALVKLSEDQSPDDFFAEFDAFVEAEFQGPLPETIFNGTVGIDAIQPGGDPYETEVSMSEGRWLLFCALSDADTETGDEGGGGDGEEPAGRAQDEEEEEGTSEDEPQLPPHYRSGMYKEITVTGDAEPTAPEADGTVTIVDYGFEGTEDLTAGAETLVAYNSPDSEQLHHLVGFDFGEGVDPAEAEEQFKAFLSAEIGGEEGGGGDGEEPAGRAQDEEGGPEELGGTFPLSPGYGVTLPMTLEAGHTYLFACFISDREGGPPHAMGHDMLKAFAIS